MSIRVKLCRFIAAPPSLLISTRGACAGCERSIAVELNQLDRGEQARGCSRRNRPQFFRITASSMDVENRLESFLRIWEI
jgi:hypothetical protein